MYNQQKRKTMKKNYIAPKITVIEIGSETILAGSGGVGTGAKAIDVSETEEDNIWGD